MEMRIDIKAVALSKLNFPFVLKTMVRIQVARRVKQASKSKTIEAVWAKGAERLTMQLIKEKNAKKAIKQKQALFKNEFFGYRGKKEKHNKCLQL